MPTDQERKGKSKGNVSKGYEGTIFKKWKPKWPMRKRAVSALQKLVYYCIDC